MGLTDELNTLYNLKEHAGMKLGLAPTIEALEKLGNPHKKLRIIHVGGTNGKGSTCAYIADTLQLAGYRVGLSTKPHLVRFNERIQINRKEISDEVLAGLITEIRETGVTLTFFEYATIIALLYYAREKVDFVVLEVGLGGTLDSTNVCDGELCCITSIGMDHMHILGDTIEKITRDKCGIIKKNSNVVTSSTNLGLKWIQEQCKQQGNELHVVEPYTSKTSLLGDFQKVNAGIAAEACRLLGVSEEIIKKGIAMAHWPGRLEYIDKNVLLDCAHNADAIKATTAYVNTLSRKRLILVFGVLKDKDYTSMVKALPKADVIILTKPTSERALDPRELAIHDAIIVEDPYTALTHAKKIAQKDDLIYVTGSCFVVASIKEELVRQRKPLA